MINKTEIKEVWVDENTHTEFPAMGHLEQGYSEQEDGEWVDCNEHGCMNCGAMVRPDELVGWPNCIHCEGGEV